MVRLNRIYTKTGDDGSTGLGDGTRLPKQHPRIAACGTVDELSSFIGLAIAHGEDSQGELLERVQNDLHDVGADLCAPGRDDGRLRITAEYTVRLEAWLDAANEDLPPAESFVLPGGTPAAARLHVARAVCRRAERAVTELCALEGETERVNPEIVRYLNRLSDLLFVLARVANDGGRSDVPWQPGG